MASVRPSIFPFPDPAPRLSLSESMALTVADSSMKRVLCFCGFLPVLVLPLHPHWHLSLMPSCRGHVLQLLASESAVTLQCSGVTRLGGKRPSCPPPWAAASVGYGVRSRPVLS